jgi:hypothetical protein
MTVDPNRPQRFPEVNRPSCGWCGLRIAITELHATPTCKECADGGKRFRVKASLKRWQRGKSKP